MILEFFVILIKIILTKRVCIIYSFSGNDTCKLWIRWIVFTKSCCICSR